MRRVLIAMPAHTGQNDVRFTYAYGETMRLATKANVEIRSLFMPGESNLSHARNDLFASAIRHKFDDLFWIDADEGWVPEAFFRVLSHPVDCVGGAVRKKTDDAELFNVHCSGGALALKTCEFPGLLTAPDLALGTGFLRLSRIAMNLLWATSEPYRFGSNTEELRWVYDSRPVNGELVGEDIWVGKKLRELGIPTYLDPSVVVEHVGPKVYQGSFVAWLQRAYAAERAQIEKDKLTGDDVVVNFTDRPPVASQA